MFKEIKDKIENFTREPELFKKKKKKKLQK